MTLTDEASPGAAEAAAAAHTKGRNVRLAVILLAQLLIVLDATVVNVALPDAQKALHMSDADRQWVVTLYALTFGSLLLLGGRIADFWGRRRTFLVGMAGFAAASALGGLAQGGSELFAARAGQGVFAAMLAPAALSLIQVNFPTGPARAKAFGLYGAIGGGGAALGLVLGGVLTEYLSWRWCLLVNVPVAIVAVVSGRLVLKESRAPGEPAYDVPGAALVTFGLASLVYGLNRASVNGWQSGGTFAFLALAVVLLVGFVLVEQRSAAPLLPMRIPVHPTRGGAYLAALIGGAALLGGLLFLTYYFQVSLQYSPITAGVASVPLTASVLVSAAVASVLLPRVGPRPLMVIGPVIAAAGLALLTQISLDSSYVTSVLPGLLLIGFGLGFLFVPMSNTALVGVADHDTGAASALVNATQQVGGAIGTALFSTIYASAVSGYLTGHDASPASQGLALLHGYRTAFAYAAGVMLLAAVIAAVLIRVKKSDLAADATVHLG
ncbi:MAG: hypothetical protein QOJ32_2035 [Frankiaceae bacterium]|nr:hypothetical protein [Frankiaceae bacterium]